MMRCRHFGRCGSCRFYPGDYEAQLDDKRSRIHRFFDLYLQDLDEGLEVFRSPTENYRARAEFKIWHVDDEIHYAMNSIDRKGVVLLEECPMVLGPIGDLMYPLLDAIRQEEDLKERLFNIDLLSTSMGEIVVSLIYHRRLDDNWEASAKEVARRFKIDIIGRSRGQKLVIGKDHVIERLAVRDQSYRFQQIENSFTQPNPRVNEQMIGWALSQFEGIGGDLLELYCGAGNFTIPFASMFDKVLATEISKSSIVAAKRNMQMNGVDNIDFVRMSAEEFVQALDGVREFRRMRDIDLDAYSLNTLFVDPPRAGLDEASRDFASRHENILYISCNPETLIRDLSVLSVTHHVTSMAMFDQFPYTEHIEMGVMLHRRVQGR